jgi:hypothetical protein
MLQVYKGVVTDDLRVLDNIFLLTYKSAAGEFGFQSDKEGKDLLLRLIQNALAISLNTVQIVDARNSSSILTYITKSKYGILTHNPNGRLIKLLDELPAFFRDKLACEMKKRRGIDCKEAATPEWLAKLCRSDQLLDSIGWLVANCRFVSIWPKYWGEYGEHCFLVSKDAQLLIEDLPNLLNIEPASIKID